MGGRAAYLSLGWNLLGRKVYITVRGEKVLEGKGSTGGCFSCMQTGGAPLLKCLVLDSLSHVGGSILWVTELCLVPVILLNLPLHMLWGLSTFSFLVLFKYKIPQMFALRLKFHSF